MGGLNFHENPVYYPRIVELYEKLAQQFGRSDLHLINEHVWIISWTLHTGNNFY